MLRLPNLWLVSIITVACLGVMMVKYRSNPDKPVSSSNTGQSPTRFTEGVEGRITDFDEKPIAGAFIQPRSLDEPKNPIPELAAFSNNDGWYRWSLRPG